MRSFVWRSMLAGLVLLAMTVMFAGESVAQCSTCATPTVAYQPVIAQPTVAYRPYTGWYPGKLIDQWRMRRATPAPTYTVGYSPYTTTYTASYTPYTAAYTPYVSAYAPLSPAVASPCNTCGSAAPCSTCTQTLARPVLMRPVIAPACNTCAYTAPACSCGTCDSCCNSGVSQATYVQSSQPACASCAGGGTVSPSTPPIPYNPGNTPNVGPQTPQPAIAAPPASQGSPYQSNRPSEQGSGNRIDTPVVPQDDEVDPLDHLDDPGPTAEETDSSTYFNAPQLLDPRDRTARRSSQKPTVDVWNAVYRKSTAKRNVSQTSTRRARTQAEIDADGWAPVVRRAAR